MLMTKYGIESLNSMPEDATYLSHFDGSNMSTNVFDESGIMLELRNGPYLSTDYKKFGDSSLKCDGVNDSVVTEMIYDIGDFTIEFWMKFSGLNNLYSIPVWIHDDDNGRYPFLLYQKYNFFDIYGDLSVAYNVGTPYANRMTNNTEFNWIVIQRTGQWLRVWINGQLSVQAVVFNNDSKINGRVGLGHCPYMGGNVSYDIYFDEFIFYPNINKYEYSTNLPSIPTQPY